MPTQKINTTRNYAQLRQSLVEVQESFADTYRGSKGRRPRPHDGWFFAIIQSVGPRGEPDFSDARYWILQGLPSPYANTAALSGAASYYPDGSGKGLLQLIKAAFGGWRPIWVPATNLAELPAGYMATGGGGSGTHTLAAGDIVICRCEPDPLLPTRKWYAFIPANLGSGSISPGQLQDQVYTMIGQNQTGWSFGPLAHPLF